MAADAPDIVKEMVPRPTSAGVGPMFTFRGAVVDQVGRFLADQLHEVTVACDGDYFIRSRKRMKLAVKRRGGEPITVALSPSQPGVGVSTTLGRGRGGDGPDGLAVIAETCMLADAAAAGVQAVLGKPDGFGMALHYLEQVPGVHGGVIVVGDRDRRRRRRGDRGVSPRAKAGETVRAPDERERAEAKLRVEELRPRSSTIAIATTCSTTQRSPTPSTTS